MSPPHSNSIALKKKTFLRITITILYINTNLLRAKFFSVFESQDSANLCFCKTFLQRYDIRRHAPRFCVCKTVLGSEVKGGMCSYTACKWLESLCVLLRYIFP